MDDLKKAHHILETVQQSKKIEINELVFVNMMNAYRRQRNYHESLKLFEQLLETGKRPSTRAFNSVLQVFSMQGSADRASYIFETMIQLDVLPDVATYTEMIRANSYAGQLYQCHHYYNLMIQNHIQPNEYTFSALIEASARKNDIKYIFRWFQTMLKQNIQPNKVVISSILKSLSKTRFQYPSMLEVVLQIAHEAAMSGIQSDAALYTILLKMQADSNGIEGALKIQRDMLENSIEPNTYTYTMLMDICGKSKMPETAEKIFDLMKHSKKCQPNTVTYSVMIDAWLKAERRDKLESVMFEFLAACKSDKTGRFWLDSRIRNRIKSRCC
jgi:pentatricopeptide repeat protein